MTVPPNHPHPQPPRRMAPRGYSVEEERAIRLSTPPPSQPLSTSLPSDDIVAAMAELEGVKDSRGMSAILLRPVYRRVAALMADGKVGASDMIRLAGMLADRVDGKVSDKVEVVQTGGVVVEKQMILMAMTEEQLASIRDRHMAALTAEEDGVL